MGSEHSNPAHFGIRTERYKLIFFYGVDFASVDATYGVVVMDGISAGWELYDLQNDPDEMRNEYSNPKYADIVKELKAELIRQRKELNEEDASYPHIWQIINKNWN